jgi:hypothetical protein
MTVEHTPSIFGDIRKVVSLRSAVVYLLPQPVLRSTNILTRAQTLRSSPLLVVNTSWKSLPPWSVVPTPKD